MEVYRREGNGFGVSQSGMSDGLRPETQRSWKLSRDTPSELAITQSLARTKSLLLSENKILTQVSEKLIYGLSIRLGAMQGLCGNMSQENFTVMVAN